MRRIFINRFQRGEILTAKRMNELRDAIVVGYNGVTDPEDGRFSNEQPDNVGGDSVPDVRNLLGEWQEIARQTNTVTVTSSTDPNTTLEVEEHEVTLMATPLGFVWLVFNTS